MPKLGRVRAWVEIDGTPLEEYAERVIHRQPGVVCHVASQAGKRFVICLTHDIKLTGSTRVVAKVYIDGEQTNYLILENEGVTQCEGTLIQHNLQRQFRFAVLPRSPDANRNSSMNRAANIGNIHLAVRLAKVEVLPGPEEFRKPQLASAEPMRPVHVGVKKGSEHYTEFGPEVETPMTYGPVYIYPIAKYPPIIFKYLYAPREIWQLRNIIPWQDQSSPPPPLPSSSATLVATQSEQGSSLLSYLSDASTESKHDHQRVPPTPPPSQTCFYHCVNGQYESPITPSPSAFPAPPSEMYASPPRDRRETAQTFPTTPTTEGLLSPVADGRQNWDTESCRHAYPLLMGGDERELLSPRTPPPPLASPKNLKREVSCQSLFPPPVTPPSSSPPRAKLARRRSSRSLTDQIPPHAYPSSLGPQLSHSTSSQSLIIHHHTRTTTSPSSPLPSIYPPELQIHARARSHTTTTTTTSPRAALSTPPAEIFLKKLPLTPLEIGSKRRREKRSESPPSGRKHPFASRPPPLPPLSPNSAVVVSPQGNFLDFQ